MKKYKLLSWVLSLVMALTVFSIPVSGYAAGEDGDTPEITYYIGWSVYDEDAQDEVWRYLESDAVINCSELRGSSIYVYQKEEEEYSTTSGNYRYVWSNSDPSVANLRLLGDYNYEQGEFEYYLSDQTTTTVDDNYLEFVPKKEGTTNLSVSVYDEETLITTISFQLVVSADDPLQYRFGWYDGEEFKVLPANTEEVNFSEIGRETWMGILTNDSQASWRPTDVPKIIWGISDPSVATISYYPYNGDDDSITSKANETEVTSLGQKLIMINPKKEGSVTLTASIFDDEEATDPVDVKTLTVKISDSDLVHYLLGYKKENGSLKLLSGDVINYTAIGDNQLSVFNDANGEMEEYVFQKMIWENETPEIALIGYYNDDGDYLESDNPQVELSDYASHSIYIIPQGEGVAKFTATIYFDEEDEDPIATINLNVNITQKDADKYKYEPYLDPADISFVDYYDRVVEGWIEDINVYNNDLERDSYRIDNLNNLSIKVTVGDKVYNATIDKNEYTFTTKKYDQVPLGTKVKVTFTMGEYSKTINTLVTKWIDPKVTVATYIYNGKSRKASVTVTYGGKTLKKGTDYFLDSDSRKSVGKARFNFYNTSTCKYRFGDEGYFKIKPKGSYITSLSGAAKAATVKWKKQSEKMSTGRINGYQIQLATNSSFTKNKKWVKVKGYSKTSVKVTKLKAKTRYYVKVRTYKTVSGTTYYSSWSKAYKVTTK